jgi:hypothetical protein
MPSLPVFQAEERVPARLGELDLLGATVYPDERLGAGFRYAGGDHVKADAYLYNPTEAPLPADLRHPLLAGLFRAAINEVIAAARHGVYLDLDVTASHYLHVPEGAPEPFCFLAAFRYRQPPGEGVDFTGPCASFLALRVDAGLVNKVRYTFPADREARQMPAFLMFLTGWVSAVQAAAQEASGET